MGSLTPNSFNGSTLTILGCGALGTAILSGILPSTREPEAAIHFTRSIACVRREKVAEAVPSTMISIPPSLQVFTRENLRGVQLADIVILACQPHLYREVLADPGIAKALSGKLLISVLAGVTESDIHIASGDVDRHVIGAMPNTASSVRDAMTVVPKPHASMPQRMVDITIAIFTCVGTVRLVEPDLMNICTTLCGSTPAFFAVVVDALVDSADPMGRIDAVRMVAQAMRGTANLMIEGGAMPIEIREWVTSPGGSTIVGVLKMEEGGVRSSMNNALLASTGKAEVLGRGIEA